MSHDDDEKLLHQRRLLRQEKQEHEEYLEQSRRRNKNNGFVSFSNFFLIAKLFFMAMVVLLIYNSIMLAIQWKDYLHNSLNPQPTTAETIGGALDATAEYFGVARTTGLLYAFGVVFVLWVIATFLKFPWWVRALLLFIMAGLTVGILLPSTPLSFMTKAMVVLVGIPAYANAMGTAAMSLGWKALAKFLEYFWFVPGTLAAGFLTFLVKKIFDGFGGKPSTPPGDGGDNAASKTKVATEAAAAAAKNGLNKAGLAAGHASAVAAGDRIKLDELKTKLDQVTNAAKNAVGTDAVTAANRAIKAAKKNVAKQEKATKASENIENKADKKAKAEADRWLRNRMGASTTAKLLAVGAFISTIIGVYTTIAPEEREQKANAATTEATEKAADMPGVANVINDIAAKAKDIKIHANTNVVKAIHLLNETASKSSKINIIEADAEKLEAAEDEVGLFNHAAQAFGYGAIYVSANLAAQLLLPGMGQSIIATGTAVVNAGVVQILYHEAKQTFFDTARDAATEVIEKQLGYNTILQKSATRTLELATEAAKKKVQSIESIAVIAAEGLKKNTPKDGMEKLRYEFEEGKTFFGRAKAYWSRNTQEHIESDPNELRNTLPKAPTHNVLHFLPAQMNANPNQVAGALRI